MNLVNIDHAINIMKRAEVAGSLRMEDWQANSRGDNTTKAETALTEVKLHACGNKACFAGHVAVSPEFHETGGKVDQWCGAPIYEGKSASGAISLWLDISKDLSDSLVYGDMDEDLTDNHSMFYNCSWSEVTAPMVIAKLELIKSGELQ